jgi:hypothetical protein
MVTTKTVSLNFLDKKVVRSFLKTVGKQFFTVTFEKKADGSLRTMNCRKGVKKHLKGGESTIKHKKNLVSVYDVKSKGYRCFDVTRVTDIKALNATLTTSQPAPAVSTPTGSVTTANNRPARVLPAKTPQVTVAAGQEWAPRRGGATRTVTQVGTDAGGEFVCLKSDYKNSRITRSRFYKDYYCVSFSAATPAAPAPSPTNSVGTYSTNTTPSTPVSTPTTPAPQTAPKLKNRVAIVLDESGSMANLTSRVVQLFSDTMKTLLDENKTDQTEVTLVRFGCSDGQNYGGAVKTAILNRPIQQLRNESIREYYSPYGNTPLWDGVAHAISEIDEANAHPETSYVVLVITDGGENGSKKIKAPEFKQLLADKQKTDKWTFAFMLPPNELASFKARKVVPDGNIQAWSDIDVASVQASTGLSAFYAARRIGRSSVKNFFTANLNNISNADLSKLEDVSHKVKIWTVDKEAAIKDFVEARNKGNYIRGNGYYALTKKETVQPQKKLLLMKKDSNGQLGDTVYFNVRGLLGMPINGDTEVVPGNLGDYVLFIESTSPNRRLVRGSPFIYVRDGEIL